MSVVAITLESVCASFYYWDITKHVYKTYKHKKAQKINYCILKIKKSRLPLIRLCEEYDSRINHKKVHKHIWMCIPPKCKKEESEMWFQNSEVARMTTLESVFTKL